MIRRFVKTSPYLAFASAIIFAACLVPPPVFAADNTPAAAPAFDFHVWLVLFITVGVMFLDWLFGIAVAAKNHDPSIQKLPAQLENWVLAYVVPLTGLALLQFFSPVLALGGVTGAMTVGFYAAAATAIAKGAQDILWKITSLSSAPPAPQPNQPAQTP